MNIVVNHVAPKNHIQVQEPAQVVSTTQVQESQEEKTDKNQFGNLLKIITTMMAAGNYYHPKHY